MALYLNGPVYVVDKSTIKRYTLANGYSETFVPDELSLENEHKEIIGNREVIKIHPFSIAFNHISLAYEKVIKVGMNLDVEAGYINNSLSGNSSINFGGYGLNNKFTSGAYVKPGVKFFLGQDFSVKGLKYAHPLKGRYIKLDLAISYINYQNITYSIYQYSNPSAPVVTQSTDLNSFSYGGFVNYGRQFILGNILTMDLYVGVGFTGISDSFTNPGFTTFASSNGYRLSSDSYRTSNYYGFLRVPNSGLSFTSGFRIGYIIPSKKARQDKTITK